MLSFSHKQSEVAGDRSKFYLQEHYTLSSLRIKQAYHLVQESYLPYDTVSVEKCFQIFSTECPLGKQSYVMLFEPSSQKHFILNHITYLCPRNRYFLPMHNYEKRYIFLLADIQPNVLNQHAFSRYQTQITGSVNTYILLVLLVVLMEKNQLGNKSIVTPNQTTVDENLTQYEVSHMVCISKHKTQNIKRRLQMTTKTKIQVK